MLYKYTGNCHLFLQQCPSIHLSGLFGCICKILKSDSFIMSVCWSNHLPDWKSSPLTVSVKIIQDSWKSDKNNKYLKWRPKYIFYISLNSSENVKWFRQKLYRTQTHILYSYNRSQRDALFLNFILIKNSTRFRQIYCPSSGVLILHSLQ